MASLDRLTDESLRTLIVDTGMPLKTFSDATGMSAQHVLEWWANRSPNLSTKNVESLSQYLGISESNLLSSDKDFCVPLIRRRLFQGPEVLPENYSQHASSYVRTMAHIVEYMAMVYGRRFTDKVLLDLNIHPLFFDNLDNRINMMFYVDVFNRLSELGVSDGEIASLASYIFLRIQDTDLGRKFRTATTYEESYSVLAQHATLFESNFEYKFEITARKIKITAKPADAVFFMSNRSIEYFRRLFSYRRSVFGWFPILSHLAPLNMRTVRCILEGDSVTVYEADVPKAGSMANLRLL